ncbi:MAG TPA: alpha/beta fold hydrolase [Chloroflexota bacterium]|nr:alpha/beta fold hydrolase [Chloroflexota bacterium]
MTTEELAAPIRVAASPRIESLLSCRLFVAPQLANNRLYFISNLGGKFSLYAMDAAGSVPEPLLPPDIALQNPELIGGLPFSVFPDIGTILVMIDRDGDENYQPMLIPVEGGIPQPAFGGRFASYRGHLVRCDIDRNAVYLNMESREQPVIEAYEGDLSSGEVTKLRESRWGSFVNGVNEDGTMVILTDGYTMGDHVVYLWEKGEEARLLYGTPLEQRAPDAQVPPNAIFSCQFTPDDRGLLFGTALFEDTYGLGYLDLRHPDEVRPVSITGTVHSGQGELIEIDHLRDNRYRIDYNIDGASWVYEGTFDETALAMRLDRVLVGQGELADGTLEGMRYDEASDHYALSFSSAVSPTQLFILLGPERTPEALTRERVLGIPKALLAPGEDASFTSFDGTRISARLYLPSAELGVEAPYPLVYYIHGGPQGQERPNFAWFSMPLIQFLTLNGFAVFVPNVRGSTGYGLSYTKQVDHDWGGNDRLDHVHAMTEVLPKDRRLDVRRAGVMGRSYGGYMTLTLASRHPELWKAAIDMFGPYDLTTFMERIPETWKPYFAIAIGNPETELDFLRERSPATYLDQISCPLFVIQGRNDPRVVEQESRDVVERLQGQGKEVDFLVFENEGHDVLKFENRVRCYNAIRDFFTKHL